MDDRTINLKDAEAIVRRGCLELHGISGRIIEELEALPSAQPVEASMILGTSKDGVRLWYQCSACGEPVADADDNYCHNCGRKFING